MAYLHKIETIERVDEIVASQATSAGLQVVVGVAPINMAADPAAVVNKPVLCRSFAEAKEMLGYSNDFEHYTLCESMDLSFRKFGVGPVVFINVLDPAKHKKSVSNKTATIAEHKAVIEEKGILRAGLTVKVSAETLVEGTDYEVSFDEAGNLVLTFASKTDGTTVTVSGTQIDPTAVTKTDVIGGYDTSTGAETGLEVLRQVYPKLGVVPGQLVCPKWSTEKEVAAVMASKIDNVSGLFHMIAVVDINTSTYKKYTDMQTARTALGITDKDVVLCWPKIMYGEVVYDYSAAWAAAAQYTDAENGDVPYVSPSNKPLGASAAVLADGTEVYLDNTQAALVNSFGVVTAINDQGWKTWGNETAAYPGSTEAKNRFIACRRMMNWYRNHLILAYKDRVDDPTSNRLIESFKDSENQFLNGLAASGYIPGGSFIAFDETANPIEKILDGEITFDIEIAFWTPAKHIVDRISFNPNLIANALGGEQ